MAEPSVERMESLFARRLDRRRALIHTSAGVVGAGSAVAAAGKGAALVQEASPVPDEPPDEETTGGVNAARAALAAERAPALAEQILRDSGVPGMAVAIVMDDAVLFAAGFGVREIGKDEPIDADTVFQLASVSKSVAATVVSSVVGDGAIGWDSRVADVAPGFALSEAWTTENVTLADLFSHRSGLPDHAGDLLEDLGFQREEILYRLRFLEPEYSFRAGYAYTNFGLTAAAEAVAQFAGMSWEDLSAERLYTPLAMAHTSSRFTDYMAQPNRAIPHVKDGDTWVVTPMQRDPDPESPAGGVSSTANDLAQWVRLQLAAGSFDGQQLIPAAALTPMHTPQAVSRPAPDPARERASFYGLGQGISYNDFGAVQWSHSGAFALGAGTAYYLLPAFGFGVLALTNGAPFGAAEALCLSVLDVATVGDVTRDWLALVGPYLVAAAAPQYGASAADSATPTAMSPAAPAATYLGVYRNDFYGDVEIVAAGDGLAMRIGPKPLEFPLRHHDRDTFTWQPIGENAGPRSHLAFLLGPDGVAVSFFDEYLQVDGRGTLLRAEANQS